MDIYWFIFVCINVAAYFISMPFWIEDSGFDFSDICFCSLAACAVAMLGPIILFVILCLLLGRSLKRFIDRKYAQKT